MFCCSATTGKKQLSQKVVPASLATQQGGGGVADSLLQHQLLTHLLYLEQSTVLVNMPVTALCSRLSNQIRQEGKLCWGTHAIALHEKHRRLCQEHHMGGILAF